MAAAQRRLEAKTTLLARERARACLNDNDGAHDARLRFERVQPRRQQKQQRAANITRVAELGQPPRRQPAGSHSASTSKRGVGENGESARRPVRVDHHKRTRCLATT